MTEISYIFLCLHLVTWAFLIILLVELNTFKKEVRQHIDYDNSLRALRKEERSKNK